ncbi:MAG: alpha-galactosidase, partial [Chitinophagaceae bacterium]
MKKLLYFVAFCCYFNAFGQSPITIKVSTQRNELIFKVGNNKRIYQSYLGSKLADEGYADKRFESYPTGGMDFEFEPAIRVVHADGNPSLELKYQKHSSQANTDGSVKTEIFLKDEVYQTEVILHYLSFPQQDVIKAWMSIKNVEGKEILLTNYASAMLHFNADNYWLSQFNGDWAKEMHMQEQPLTSGIKVIDSKLGTRANKYQSPHFFLSPGTRASTEDTGELIAATLAWTGNFKFSFEIDNKNQLHVGAGINNYA